MSLSLRSCSLCACLTAIGLAACNAPDPNPGTSDGTSGAQTKGPGTSTGAGGINANTTTAHPSSGGKASSSIAGGATSSSPVGGATQAGGATSSSPVGGATQAGGATSSSPVGGATSIPSTGGATTVDATAGSAGVPTDPAGASEQVPANLQQALSTAQSMTAASLVEAYPPPSTKAISYDAANAKGMELLQASALSLNDNEKQTLATNGFAISQRTEYPSFAYGYRAIYAQDLPVYVSADSILEAVHRTFDTLLKRTEEQVLMAELKQMLDGMRAKMAGNTADGTVATDADFYLTVASSLLAGQRQQLSASAASDTLSTLYDCLSTAQGHQTVTLFGVERDEDCSQFEPRGHYTETEALKRYFKAMMWLGRVDLRLIETDGDGSQRFHRRQFDAAVKLREVMDATAFELWEHIDTTIGAYVGEHDSMTPKALDGLMKALGVTSLAESSKLTDQQIINEIARGGWGAQRIASRIIIKENDGPTLPLDRSFLIFGQRYTVDSHTFVNVTYDRVANRMMPKPLDVGFAALGNNAALPLLSSEFSNTSYVQALAKTRALVDAHEPAYWEGSLYTRWLSALRSLSPADLAALPSVTRTDPWQARMLSAQLGSWAELRHDTILYAKQSYTAGVSCEFPDAYVDPYPEFYAKLGTLADAIGMVTESLPDSSSTLKATCQSWVSNFKTVTSNLQKMAQNQLAGTAHSAELLAFINDAVKWDEKAMCGGSIKTNLGGWYLKLYLDQQAGLEYEPVVADVHTQPTDEAGNDVGRILHVGIGRPRMMVVTAETCQGPRAYVGLAFSYGEYIAQNWERLNDQEWEIKLNKEPFPDVSWMSPVLAK